jgi:multidrug efflux pump subunit AcrB
MALIGLLSLSGMLIRNGIVLVEEIEQQNRKKRSRRRLLMPPPRVCALSC